MTKQKKQILKRKNAWKKVSVMIIISVILVGLSVSIFYIISKERRIQYHNIINEKMEGQSSRKAYQNFTIDSTLKNPTTKNETYYSYSLNINQFNNVTANDTIKKYFGDLATETKMSVINKTYSFVKNNDTFVLFPDNIIEYVNNCPRNLYSEKEINENKSLLDINESKIIGEKYINNRIGVEFKDFIFIEQKYSYVYLNNGTKMIKRYVYYYTRNINNLTCFDNSAGQIIIALSPNGSVLSFQYQTYDLKESKQMTLPEISASLAKVDDNFDKYRYYLLAGHSDFVMYKIEQAYGRVDDILVIGWRLWFYCDGDPSLISDTFVY